MKWTSREASDASVPASRCVSHTAARSHHHSLTFAGAPMGSGAMSCQDETLKLAHVVSRCRTTADRAVLQLDSPQHETRMPSYVGGPDLPRPPL